MTRRMIRSWGTVLYFVLLPVGVQAQVQRTSGLIPLSGYMPGQPDGPVDLRLRLFPLPSGGAPCFEETQTVQVTAEAFNAFIGDATAGGIPPSPCFTNNESLWMAFAMEATPDGEIGGRTAITSSGYAHFARKVAQGPGSGLDADTLQGSGPTAFAPASGSPNYAPASGSPNYAPASGSPNYAPASGSPNYLARAGGMMTGPLLITPNSTGFALRFDQGINGDGFLAYVNTTSPTRTVLSAGSNVAGLTVKGDGSVGIGTTNPGAKLQVVGKAVITGRLGVNNPPSIDYGITLPNTHDREGVGLGVAWVQYSSRRWKTNIQTIDGALEKVGHLRGVSFDWKENGTHDIGLIAEEVGEVVPEVVDYEDNRKDAKSVDYARLNAVLIEAVKEQQRAIEELKNRIERLERPVRAR